MLFKIEEIDAASAKRFMFDIKLLERSFMDIKKSNGLKIEPCSMPALISSQWDIRPLSRTLRYMLCKKTLKNC